MTAVSPTSTSKSTSASTPSSSPRPCYFISRNDGTLTPLIAVDELPASIHIVGVPATISLANTIHMISLGVGERSQLKYIVETSGSSVASNPIRSTPQSVKVESNSGILENPTQDPSNTVGSNSGILENSTRNSSNAVGSNSGILENPTRDSSNAVRSNSEILKTPLQHSPVADGSATAILGKSLQDAIDIVPRDVADIPQDPSVGALVKFEPVTKTVEEWRQGVKDDELQVRLTPTFSNKSSSNNIKVTIDAIANQGTAVPSDSGTPNAATPGTLGKKIYCTHWIRWGECDYTQQGCRYKHEMPDEPTLNSIGIRTFPKWYRDVNAPKKGWTERPAPADQLWRGKPDHPAQPPQPTNLLPSSGRPATVPHHKIVLGSQPNLSSTHPPYLSRGSNGFRNGQNSVQQRGPGGYQPRISRGSNTFGNGHGQNFVEQHPPPPYQGLPFSGPNSFGNGQGQNHMDQQIRASYEGSVLSGPGAFGGQGRNLVEQHAPASSQGQLISGSNVFGNNKGQNPAEPHPQASYGGLAFSGSNVFGGQGHITVEQHAPASSQGQFITGPNAFGNARNLMEQLASVPPGSNALTQTTFAPPTLSQSLFAPPGPVFAHFMSSYTPARKDERYDLLPTVAPSFRPLEPTISPASNKTNSMLAPPPPHPSTLSGAFCEPKTPAPQHRRLFVPKGESEFVTNSVPVQELRGHGREGRRFAKGRKLGNWSSNGGGNGSGNEGGNGNGKDGNGDRHKGNGNGKDENGGGDGDGNKGNGDGKDGHGDGNENAANGDSTDGIRDLLMDF